MNSRKQQRNRKKLTVPRKLPAPITADTKTMGIDCSKNIPVVNKSTVAPKPYRAPQPPQNHSRSVISHGAPVRKKPPAPQPKRTVSAIRPSVVDEKPSVINEKPSVIDDKLSVSQIRPPVNNIKSTSTNSLNNNRSCGKIVPNTKIADHSSVLTFMVAPIDTNSIIFDRSDDFNAKHTSIKRTKSISRSCSVDSSSDRSVNSEPKKSSRNLHRFFKSNINLTSSNASGSDNNLNFMRFYHRLSDGVQTLFSGNLSGLRKHNMSASDTNLNLRRRGGGRSGGSSDQNGRLSQQQLIDNDYCPSVLYNRKARKSCSDRDIDKSQTFQRWKQQIWMKFSRRKQPTTRKTYVSHSIISTY